MASNSPPSSGLRHLTISLLLGGLAAVGLPQELPAQDAGSSAGVRPGDRVSIEVFTGGGARIPELTGEHRVDREGEIYLPFVGNLIVEGRSATEIREHLVDELSSFYESPVAVVSVELRVNVTGAVGRPGHYFLDPSSTVLDALAEAGGSVSQYSFRSGVAADPTSVRLTREGEVRILNLQAGSVDRETLNLRIRSGDWIHVPEATRSAIRENVQLVSSVLGLVVTIVVLATR